MEIVFQNHDAPVSDRMRRRAEEAVRKVAARVQRPVDAVIRFQQDGAVRRVELTLHAAPAQRWVARADARYFGTALATATRKLGAQVGDTKRSPKARARRVARRGSPRTA